MTKGQTLYDWCQENGERGQQLLYEFGDGNNSQQFINEFGIILTPHSYSKCSHQKIKWTCKNNHSWYTRVGVRVNLKSNCPYCSNSERSKLYIKTKVKLGENDLYTWCLNNGDFGQQIIQEWTGICNNGNHYEIKEVAKLSRLRVMWKCHKGHKWYVTITSRTLTRSKCPYCSIKGTSYPEQFLYRALLQIYPDTITRGRYNNIEYDITIPEEKTCIEYSGWGWHKNNIDRDLMKAQICKEHEIRFIQIYAHNGEFGDNDNYESDTMYYKVDHVNNNEQLAKILKYIVESFGHSLDEIDIEKAKTEAFNFMQSIDEDNTESVKMLPKSSLTEEYGE